MKLSSFLILILLIGFVSCQKPGADQEPVLPEEKPKPDSAPLTIQAPDPDRRYIVTSGDEMGIGPESAPVQVVEFTDFQCPFCRKANAEAFHELRATYGDKLRWVVRHFPLPIHPSAHGAARAAWAAGQQNAFWAFHQALFEAKGSLGRRMFEDIAETLKLDVEQFRRDFESPKSKAAVDRDQEFARKLGVSGTPALFINGRFLSGALSTPTYTRLVEEELAAAEKAKSEGISNDKFVEFRLKDAIPESGFPNSGEAPKP